MSETKHDPQFKVANWQELKVHPAAHEMREMNETERAWLRESLERHGFQPEGAITLDSEDQIVDGRSRFQECLELARRGISIEPVFRRWNGKGSVEEYVQSRNVARRHLTPAEQEAQIRRKLTEDPTRADRVIAREVGASPTTVGKKRHEMEDAGQLSSVDSSVGADLRRRTRKPRSAKPGEKPPEGGEPGAASAPIEELKSSDPTDDCLKANLQTAADPGQKAEDDLPHEERSPEALAEIALPCPAETTEGHAATAGSVVEGTAGGPDARGEGGPAHVTGNGGPQLESDWAERLRALDPAEQVPRLDDIMMSFDLGVQRKVAGRIAHRWGKDIKGRPPKGARSVGGDA